MNHNHTVAHRQQADAQHAAQPGGVAYLRIPVTSGNTAIRNGNGDVNQIDGG